MVIFFKLILKPLKCKENVIYEKNTCVLREHLNEKIVPFFCFS